MTQSKYIPAFVVWVDGVTYTVMAAERSYHFFHGYALPGVWAQWLPEGWKRFWVADMVRREPVCGAVRDNGLAA